jgi:hypothetical protein
MNRDDLHERVDAMVAATDAFCAEHLTEEFGEMCANLTDELAMHHEDLLERGQPKSWAAGVLYAIARVNFLFDASMEPHMRADELCSLFGVSQGNASEKATRIMDAMDFVPMHPDWTVDARKADNPLIWTVLVGGVPADIRTAPMHIRRSAYEDGVIPYIPDREGNRLPDDVEGEYDGRWRITYTHMGDSEYVAVDRVGAITVDGDGDGSFALAGVTGELHGQMVDYPGWDRLEFTWSGEDDGCAAHGFGWIACGPSDEYAGEIRVHRGDEYEFLAEKLPLQGAKAKSRDRRRTVVGGPIVR